MTGAASEAPARGPDPAALWRDAGLAAALVAIDPAGLGGVCLTARHGPARAAWLEAFTALLPEGTPLRRLPPAIADDRLLGGLDLAATLSAGRPVARAGLLAEADGGVVILPMAERAEAGLVGRLAAALDTGELRAERDGLSVTAPARIGVVALDEDEGEEGGLAPPLADRLALRVDLSALSHRDLGPVPYSAADVAAARAALPETEGDPEAEAALAATALSCGLVSLRPALQAARAARALMALHGPAMSPSEAAEIAARLVIAPRALQLPAPPETDEETQEETPPDPPPEQEEAEARSEDETQPLPDRVLEAVRAALPPELLASLAGGAAPRGQPPGGRAGAARRAPDRGRPIGARPGAPDGRARLDLVETLRAAAPWQRLRRTARPEAPQGQVLVSHDDFRIKRFKRQTGTTTIFVVDASGSAAVARLAEAKGAVEMLLAEAYVRRDEVALVAFRGQGAEVLLPPTRSPALAKTRLAALPGGGGTPVASGLAAGLTLAERVREGGSTPLIVLLSDGGANIARDGTQGRAAAREDAHLAARALRAAGIGALVIDTGARPRREAETLAAEMGARYLPMPRADASALSRAARQAAS